VQRYRALTAELALSMMPKPMQPAETLGMSGFEFAIASTSTNISQKAAYWQGQAGQTVMEKGKVPSSLWTPTLHVRKGLPFSGEVGAALTYMAFSDMFMLSGEAKIALHEAHHRWVPAVAVRFSGGKLIGASDLDISTAEWGLITSLPVGLGGMALLTPFVGMGQLYSEVNSDVIDETPEISTDQRGGTTGSLYSFPTLKFTKNFFTRIFLGFRINIATVEVMYEADFGLIPYSFAKRTIVSHSFKFGLDV